EGRALQPVPGRQLHLLRHDAFPRGVRRRALPGSAAAGYHEDHHGPATNPHWDTGRTPRRPRRAPRGAHGHRVRAEGPARVGQERPGSDLSLRGARRRAHGARRRAGDVRQHPHPRQKAPVDRGHHAPLGRLPGVPAPPRADAGVVRAAHGL
ncbi:MAG: hypothetical protein AVDCRST_MAG01-01-374, partial [uncultured Rubrobacteraceae bacterium]